MANQSPDRRKILMLLGRVAAVSQFPGFSRWACGLEGAPEAFATSRAGVYHPIFFSAAEYGTIDTLAEQIIPRDATAGAHDAGVAEFIDFMVAHDSELQYPFRTGLAWLDAFAMEKNGSRFVDLPPDTREALVRKLAYRKEQAQSERQGHEFFALFRKWTVIGYYTSHPGLEELDYPGLRLYSASPACPHKNDPEHRHLGGSAA